MNEQSYAPSGYDYSTFGAELRQVRYFKAWFFFALLSTFCSFGAGMLIGAFAGAIMGAAQVDLRRIVLVAQVLGFLVSLPISFLCFRWATNKFILPQVDPSAAERPQSF